MKKIYTILFVIAGLQAFSQNDSVYYHDYVFESQYGASGAYPAEDYMQMITRFTPPYYPARLIGVRVWFRNAVQPAVYKIVVREDATASTSANNSGFVYMSPSGIPNPSSGGTPDSAYENYIDLSSENLIFNSGDIYAGITQNLQLNGFVGFALDTNNAFAFNDRHWISTSQGSPGSWWLFSGWAFIYANFGVTAFFDPVSTSLTEDLEKDGIRIFPNPANESMAISQWRLKENMSVKIFDAGGRMVFENYFTGNIKVNTADWSNGLYFVKLYNEKTSARRKVAVMH